MFVQSKFFETHFIIYEYIYQYTYTIIMFNTQPIACLMLKGWIETNLLIAVCSACYSLDHMIAYLQLWNLTFTNIDGFIIHLRKGYNKKFCIFRPTARVIYTHVRLYNNIDPKSLNLISTKCTTYMVCISEAIYAAKSNIRENSLGYMCFRT